MHDFTGKWRITWMAEWDQKYVDLIQPGYFEFTEDGLGEFVFGAVKGWVDVRVSTRMPVMEFSWQGVSEGDDMCGRGRVDFISPIEGEGHLLIHCGDESAFRIEKMKNLKVIS